MRTHTSTTHLLLSAVLLIVASLCHLTATAYETLYLNGINYTIQGDTVVVTSISSTEAGATVNIPATVTSKVSGNSFPVTAIGYNAAENNLTLEKVTYRQNLKYIHQYAFRGCTNLKSFAPYSSSKVTAKSNLVRVNIQAFKGCTALGTNNTSGRFELTSEQPLNISQSAFEGCTGIKDLTVKSSQSLTVGTSVFQGCTALTSASFDKCSTFGSRVFENCTNLKTIHLGSATHVTLGNHFCYNCTALTRLYTSNQGNGFSVVDKVGEYAFQHCTSLETHNLGLVKEIGKYGFNDCTGFTSLSLGSLETIGRNAFSGLTVPSLIIPQTLKSFEMLAFADINTDVVYVNSQAVANASDIDPFGGAYTFTDLRFGYITEIKGSIFKSKNKVTSLTFDSYLRTIGDGAFKGMHVTNLTIDNPNLNIGTEAFRGCTNLASVSLNCLNIYPNAFSDCTAMKTLDVKALSAMDEAFSGCSGLEQTSLDVHSVCHNVFRGCSGEVNISKWSTQYLRSEENALYNAGFTTINYSATELPEFAIMGMPRLTTVNFRGTKTFTTGAVFRDCPNLTTFTMTDSDDYKVEDDVIYTADGTTLILTPPAKVDYAPIPATVRTIKSFAITSPQAVLDFSQIPATPVFQSPTDEALPAVIIANMAQDFSAITAERTKPHIVYVAGDKPADFTGDNKVTVLDAVKAIEGLKSK